MSTQQSSTMRWAMIAIVILSGAWTLFHIVWNLAQQTADDYWGIALLILFLLSLIFAFVQYFQERSALKVVSSSEQFPEPAISKFFLASTGSAALWFVVRMYRGTNGGGDWYFLRRQRCGSPMKVISARICSWYPRSLFWYREQQRLHV